MTLDTYGTDGTDGKNAVITVDDNAKIYFVDKKGNISESSYSAIYQDVNDKVYAIVEDYLVKTLIVEEVDDDKKPSAPSVIDGYEVSTKISGTTVTVTAKATTSAETILDLAVAALDEAGYSDIHVKNITTISATKGKVTVDYTVVHNKAYKVTFTTADAKVVCSPASIYLAQGDEVSVEVTNGYSTWDTVRTWTATTLATTAMKAAGTGKVQTVTMTVGAIAADTNVVMSWT